MADFNQYVSETKEKIKSKFEVLDERWHTAFYDNNYRYEYEMLIRKKPKNMYEDMNDCFYVQIRAGRTNVFPMGFGSNIKLEGLLKGGQK